MSNVSVIMVSYHTGNVLPVAIASVLMQDGLTELLVIDNGNPPDVIAQLQQRALMDPRLKIITGHGNVGFAAACNLGARAAAGEYLLLLNPDCILPPGALTALVRGMNILPNTMLAGAHMVNPDGSEQRGGRRCLLTPSSALGEMAGLRKLNRHHTPMPCETHDVAAVSGACMCIRKADFELLGGMDEGYFLHVEDMDLCMRVAKAGKRIVCVPEVTIAHLLSTSGNASSSFIEQHKAKGFVRYFEKHFSETAWPGLIALLKAAISVRYALRKWSRRAGREHSGKAIAASRKLMILASSLTEQPQHGVFAGKTVLVTGATSQVGVYVVKHLLGMGAAVLAVSREDAPPFAHPGLKWLKRDITRDDFSLDGYLADIAIHSAPQWYLPKIIPVLANSDVRRIVSIGSTSVFSKAASHNGFEKDLVAKHARAEQETATLCDAKNIAWTILRPTMIYGVGLDKNISSLSRFIERFGFFPVYPPAMGRRQPVHAEDVAFGALQAVACETAFGKSYNVSGGDILTYRAMLEQIFAALNRPMKIVESTLLPFLFSVAGVLFQRDHVTSEVAYRMNEDLIFFHDDATHDFGYHPRGFLSGGAEDLGL